MARGALSEQIGLSLVARSIASGDAQSLPLFQQLTRGDPPRGDDVRPLSAIAAERGGPAVRARHRHLP